MSEGRKAVRPSDVLTRVRIVLVRPRDAMNVGAAARAMKNMGMLQLTLVKPAVRAVATAATVAVHARDIVARARTVETVAEAVGDCHLVVGTTCRGGLYRAAAETAESLAPVLARCARDGRVALLFGPEDHGLTNEDLKHCQRLMTVDTSAAYPSLNLAQAVLLCCYELRRAVAAETHAAESRTRAPAADVQFMLARVQAALLRIGFLHPQNPDHIMFALRRVLGRAELEPADVRILLGIARQIEWYARAGWQRSHSTSGEEVLVREQSEDRGGEQSSVTNE